MNDQGDALKAICDEVINDPDLHPRNGQTFCNVAARRIASALGCQDFDNRNLVADELIAIMMSSFAWSKVDGSTATIHALGGGLAFAAMTSVELGEAHGHLAAIYPVGMGRSASLQKDVPYVANCGKSNGEQKVSQAFPPSRGEPEYFCWSA